MSGKVTMMISELPPKAELVDFIESLTQRGIDVELQIQSPIFTVTDNLTENAKPKTDTEPQPSIIKKKITKVVNQSDQDNEFFGIM